MGLRRSFRSYKLYSLAANGSSRLNSSVANNSTNPDFPSSVLLDILVCPLSKQPLIVDRKLSLLVSEGARVGFKFDSHGVINMIPRDAILLNDEQS